MQLSEDTIIFELSDFEFVRSSFLKKIQGPHYDEWMDYYYGDPEGFILRCISDRLERYSKSINKRFSHFIRGIKGKNTKEQAFLVIEYLWKNGTPKHEMGDFRWIPLTQISHDLVIHRGVGRPRKKKFANREEVIPHYNTLMRVLKGLKDVELVDYKKEVIGREKNPNKQKENSFYRLSDWAFSEAVTKEEKMQEEIEWLRKEDKMQEEIEWLRKEDKRGRTCEQRLDCALKLLEATGYKEPDITIDRMIKKEEQYFLEMALDQLIGLYFSRYDPLPT